MKSKNLLCKTSIPIGLTCTLSLFFENVYINIKNVSS